MFEIPSTLPPLPACLLPSAPLLPKRILQRAERHIAHRRYDQAVTDLQDAIALGADAYLCTLHIADLEGRRENWQPALCAVEEAAALAPERLLAHEMRLRIAMQAGDYACATQACHALLKRMPCHLPAYETLEMIYMQADQMDAALRALNAQLRLCPDDPACHFRRGLLCQHQGDIGMALQAFTHALYLDPSGPLADEAREAMEALDAFQLNHILTLGMEDAVFRARLRRNAGEAAARRGFILSAQGAQILSDLCIHLLPDTQEHCRSLRVN